MSKLQDFFRQLLVFSTRAAPRDQEIDLILHLNITNLFKGCAGGLCRRAVEESHCINHIKVHVPL